MMRFLYVHYIKGRPRPLFVWLVMACLGAMVFLAWPDQNVLETWLFVDQATIHWRLLMPRLTSLVFPFVVVMLAFEHDMRFIKPLHAYLGRSRVILGKIVFFTGMLAWTMLLFTLLYLYLPVLLWSGYQPPYKDVPKMAEHLLDGLVLLGFILYAVRNKSRALALLLGLLQIVLINLYEDLDPWWYVIVPLYHPLRHQMTHHWFIKTAYLGLLYLLVVKKGCQEPL